jgi:hypothetical protein
MKVYLYIPEDLDASEHLITAAQNNIDQIIHGPSDILKDVMAGSTFIVFIFSFLAGVCLVFSHL